jgi:hypothetical protein
VLDIIDESGETQMVSDAMYWACMAEPTAFAGRSVTVEPVGGISSSTKGGLLNSF